MNPTLRRSIGPISNKRQKKAKRNAKQRAEHRILQIRVAKLEKRIEEREPKIEEINQQRRMYLKLIHRDIHNHQFSLRKLKDEERSYQVLRNRVDTRTEQEYGERQSTDDVTESTIVNDELEEQAIIVQVLKGRVLRTRQLTKERMAAGWRITAQYVMHQGLLDKDIRERELLGLELKVWARRRAALKAGKATIYGFGREATQEFRAKPGPGTPQPNNPSAQPNTNQDPGLIKGRSQGDTGGPKSVGSGIRAHTARVCSPRGSKN